MTEHFLNIEHAHTQCVGNKRLDHEYDEQFIIQLNYTHLVFSMLYFLRLKNTHTDTFRVFFVCRLFFLYIYEDKFKGSSFVHCARIA